MFLKKIKLRNICDFYNGGFTVRNKKDNAWHYKYTCSLCRSPDSTLQRVFSNSNLFNFIWVKTLYLLQ